MSGELSKRSTHVVVDELGMDPLRDKSYDIVLAVKSWTYYTVNDSDRYNMPLIADNAYRNPDFWWCICIYNGILDPFTVESGTRLKIPDLNEILSAMSEKMQYNESDHEIGRAHV